MSETDRRGFLRGGLKAALAGTGGLLLPWQGGNAFALPTDLGAAAGLPVRATPFPVSKECLQLRHIVECQREYYRRKYASHSCETTSPEWRAMAAQYRAIADVVLARPITTWGQASEIAEIAWRYHQKTWTHDGQQPERLVLAHNPETLDRPVRGRPSATALLIDGVLALAAGERNDPDDWNASQFRHTL